MEKVARFWIRAPHLSAAGVALLAAILLMGVLIGPFHFEDRLARLTAPEMLEVKDQGIALQDAAFEDPHLLPVYGSSEFLADSQYAGPHYFANSPTGFKIFIIGKAGAKTLIIAQRIAALGDKVRGKKVVIILSPVWFLAKKEGPAFYDGNFSALQADDLAFDSPLSLSLKSAFAREMLKYPESLVGHALLRYQLEHLAEAGGGSENPWVTDLGKSGDYLMQTLDQYQTLFALSGEMLENPPGMSMHIPRHTTRPDWNHLLQKAASYSDSRSYESVVEDGATGDEKAEEKLDAKLFGKNQTSFTTMLDHSDEWFHLDLLLRTLRELGADPLIISIPINGVAFAKVGVTAPQRQDYYARLEEHVRPFGYPLKTFEESENDPNFFGDSLGHPSAKGWMIFNRTINAFYHNKLPVSPSPQSAAAVAK